MEQLVNIGLIFAYILVVVGGLSAIVLPLINSLRNPRTLIYAGIAIGVLLVVYLISYAMAGAEVNANYLKYGVDSGISKAVGGAIITMYVITFISVIGIAFTEISKMLK